MSEAVVTERSAGGRRIDLLMAAGVGLAGFLAVVGVNVLDVRNVLWLGARDDSLTHYLGWAFFRSGPATFPPGLNPDYGMQVSSSIIFSDSIPLLALPLKLLSPLLPAVFQFTGWWTLLCFVLQAWLAISLVALFSRDRLVKLGVAGLLVFAPPFLWRLDIHFSLLAHWLPLTALYLYFAPAGRFRPLWWIALFFIAALIHTYFVAMCLSIWLASLFRRQPMPDRPVLPRYLEASAILAALCAALWLGGFFPLRPSMISFGYGQYSLNMLALINPNGSFGHPWSWSALLPMLPQGGNQYEGFNYLGAGCLLLVVAALPLALVGLGRGWLAGRGLWPIILVAIGLTVFAVSPLVSIGDRLIAVPVPELVYALADTVRASGRFFWPVFYLIVLGAAFVLHRALGGRILGPLLIMLVAVQVYDTFPGWSALREKFALTGTTLTTSLNDPRLAAIATHYAAVRSLPSVSQQPGWGEIASFALEAHLPTDVAYLARTDDAAHARYTEQMRTAAASHGLDPTALYFLDADFARLVARTMTPDDELFRAGDFLIFAPGWHRFGVSTDLPVARNP